MEVSIMESAKFRISKERVKEAEGQGTYLGGGTMREVYEKDGLVYKFNGYTGKRENLRYCNRPENANTREWNLYQEFDEATRAICNKVYDFVKSKQVLVVKKCPSVVDYLEDNFGISENKIEHLKPWDVLKKFSEELKGFSLPCTRGEIVTILCHKWRLNYIEVTYIKNWGVDLENKRLVLIDWDR